MLLFISQLNQCEYEKHVNHAKTKSKSTKTCEYYTTVTRVAWNPSMVKQIQRFSHELMTANRVFVQFLIVTLVLHHPENKNTLMFRDSSCSSFCRHSRRSCQNDHLDFTLWRQCRLQNTVQPHFKILLFWRKSMKNILEVFCPSNITILKPYFSLMHSFVGWLIFQNLKKINAYSIPDHF